MTVVWNEPLCLDEGCVVSGIMRATEADIIKLQKHNFPERDYTDKEALADFMTVNWAWTEPDTLAETAT